LTPSKIPENNHNLLRSGCPQIYLNLIDIEIVAIANATNNSRSSTQLKFGGVYAEEVDLAVLASWTQLLEKFFAMQIIKYVGEPNISRADVSHSRRYPLIFGTWREVRTPGGQC
jgi:hypothetical protein